MEKMLEKHLQRQLKLITLLYTRGDLTFKEIQFQLGYSPTTFRKDLVAINTLIAPSKINQIQDFLYQLVLEESIESVYTLFMTASFEFQLLNEILLKKTTITKLAQTFFCSESTIRRSLTKISSILAEDFNLTINTKTLWLEGAESTLLSFVAHFLKEYYGASHHFLSSTQRELLYKMYIERATYYQENFLATTQERFALFVYAIILAKRHGQTFTFLANRSFDALWQTSKSPFLQEFGVPLSDELMKKISSIFFNDTFFLTYHALTIAQIKDTAVHATYTTIYEMIHLTKEKYHLMCEEEERLVLTLYNFCTLLYGREYILFDRYRYFIEHFSQEHSEFFQWLHQSVCRISKINNSDKQEHFLFLFITQWPELYQYLSTPPVKMKIGIYFTSDKQHNDFLTFYLKQKFSATCEIINLYEHPSADTIDVLIANKPSVYQQAKPFKLIVATLFPDKQLLQKINKAYKEWIDSNKHF